MRLHYKATTKDGKIEQGIIDAKDINEAAGYLRSKELMPIRIIKEQENPISNLIPFLSRVKSSDVILFTRQLSSMLASGLTLMRALGILKEQIQSAAMQEIVNSIINDVEEGKTFSFAITKYPNVFSPIYISIIKAGEASGLMDKVLSRLADNLEKDAKLKGTIRSALMYPVIIVVLMVGVMAIMMIFVIPQLTTLYQNLNVALPLPFLSGMSFTFLFNWFFICFYFIPK
jgi:type II secretory pathway component PulF